MVILESHPFGLNICYYFNKASNSLSNFNNVSNSLSNIIFKNKFVSYSPEGISSFFTFRFPIGSLTMFKDYYKISCGSKLKNDKIISYWYPRFESINISFEEALKEIESLLFDSIKSLVEDKNKIGFAMSGGIDSSLIVALCRKLFPHRELYTYSAGFYGEDEFEYSRLVAKELKTNHTEKILSKEDFIGKDSLLKPLIKNKGEPLHPNELALANIEKIAKKDGCEIVLCGEGADDIFGGYGQNFRMYVNYKKDEPFFRFFLNNYRYFTVKEKEFLLNNDYNFDDYKILMNVINQRELSNDIKNYIPYFTQKIHTIGLITRGINAMNFNRLPPGFPFIDMKLVDFTNNLPFDYKVKWKDIDSEKKALGLNFRDISENLDVPKFILKKLAEKYLPNKVIYRPKYGFPVPFDLWFKDLKDWDLNEEIFKVKDISNFNGWKKFMIINLNTFISIFNSFRN